MTMHCHSAQCNAVQYNEKFKTSYIFRRDCIPRRVHRGVVQPQEEQATAHRQPWQEDHHCRRMVSTIYIVVFVFVL